MKFQHRFFCLYDNFIGEIGRVFGQATKLNLKKQYQSEIQEFCKDGDVARLGNVLSVFSSDIFPYIGLVGIKGTKGGNVQVKCSIEELSFESKNDDALINDNIRSIVEEILYSRKKCVEAEFMTIEQRLYYKMFLYSCLCLVELYLNVLLKKMIKSEKISLKSLKIDGKILACFTNFNIFEKNDDFLDKNNIDGNIKTLKNDNKDFKKGYDAFDHLRKQRNKWTHSEQNAFKLTSKEIVESLNKINDLGVFLKLMEDRFVAISNTAFPRDFFGNYQTVIVDKSLKVRTIYTIYPIILKISPKISN